MGMPGQGVDMLGSTVPFPRTEAERQATGDHRPSIEARYADRDDYLGRVGAAAQDLVEHRFLLDGDVAVVVDAARRAWDLFTTVRPVGS